MKTIKLTGRLGREFGREHKLDVRDPAEAVRALCTIVPGFEASLNVGEYYLTKRRGTHETTVNEDDLALGFGGYDVFVIAPKVKGSKNKGLGKAILGIAIVAGAFIAAPLVLGAGSTLATTFAASGIGSAFSFGTVAQLGVMIALNGVSQMLTPKIKATDKQRRDSFLIDATGQLIDQGNPVPLVFGEVWTGSYVISAGVSTEETSFEDHPEESDSEEPNTLRSRATARILDLISEGPCEGIVDGWKSIYFDDVALQNSDDSVNFKGVTVTPRQGTTNQDPISGFSEVEGEVNVGLEVKKATPVTVTITDDTVNAARVKIMVPALTYYNEDDQILEGTEVSVRVDMKTASGSFTTMKTVKIDGKTTSPYERQVRVELPEGGAPWQIRLTRLTDDSESVNLNNETHFSSYTEIVDAKLRYPDSAIVGLTYDAKLFGSQAGQRLYHYRGLKIQIPNNYNPINRTYTGLWDGGFTTAWTDNPAWIFYALATNRRWGLGDIVAASSVDKWALYAIGQYCDGTVPDGYGGTEPRYTFNGVLRTRMEAAKTLDIIANVFRGMVYWGAGAVTVTHDAPGTPTTLVTNANVIDGDFNYVGAALSSRHSSVYVEWNDPTDRGKASTMIVQKDELIQKFGDRREEVTAVGCTSRGQAKRVAEWILFTEEYETEVVSYSASLDHSLVRPGQLISIADASFAGARFGGRLSDAASNGTFTVDAPIQMTQGENYTVAIAYPSGTIKSYPIVNTWATPGTQTVTVPNYVANNWTIPPDDALFVITGTDAAPRTFRVVANVEKEPNVYEITAIQHISGKYNYVERQAALVIPPYTVAPSGALAPVPSVTPSYYMKSDPGSSRKLWILASWQASPDPRASSYNVSIKEPGGNWRSVGNTPTISLDIPATKNATGTYQIKVEAVSITGGVKSVATTGTMIISSLGALPSPPTGWTGHPGYNQITLKGDPDDTDDFKAFRIYGSTSASTALVYLAQVSGTTYTRQVPDTDPYTRYKVSGVSHTTGESDPTLSTYINVIPIPITPDDIIAPAPGTTVGLVLETSMLPDNTSEVRATWTPSVAADISYYDVRIKQTTGGTYVSAMTTSPNFKWAVLPNVSYTVSVRAVNTMGRTGNYSTEAVIVSAADTIPPAVPTGLTATGTFAAIWLSWNPNTETDFKEYEIYESTSTTAPSAGTAATFTVGATTLVRNNLAENVTRHYWIRGVDSSNNKSAWSARVQATTLTLSGTQGAPAVPTGLSLSTVSQTGLSGVPTSLVRAAWTAAALAVSYEVGVTQAGGSEVIIGVGDLFYEFQALPNIAYAIRVRSVNNVGVKSAFTTVQNITSAVDTGAPSVPANPAAVAGFGSIWLTWDRVVVADLAYYEIYESATSTPAPSAGTAASFTSTSATHNRNGFADGVTRHYWIRSVDTSNNKSGWSTRVSATTVDTAVTTADLVGLIDYSSFPAGLEPIGIVNVLPNPVGYVGPSVVRINGSNKLYRYEAGAWTTEVLAEDIDSRGLDILDIYGDVVFSSTGEISNVAYITVDGNNILLSSVAANSLVPSLNYVGEFATAPTEVDLGDGWVQNAVYKNSTDGKSYVLTGSPLDWVVYLEDGKQFYVTIESTNGTVFRIGQGQSTLLIARVFKNGAEITTETPSSWFRWRRVSMSPLPPPDDDATWNAAYNSGFKQISVNVDDVASRATFFIDIISS